MNSSSTHKPFLVDAQKAHKDKIVLYQEDGTAELSINNELIIIDVSHQYDLTQAALFGLNERLTIAANAPKLEDNSSLRELFNQEWELYSEVLAASDGVSVDYGVYVYFPSRGDLVKYPPKKWFRIVSIASNSTLISDPKDLLSWEETQKIFANSVIGVAGCSVGSNIALASLMEMRPKAIKLADQSSYKMENINRVRLNYRDLVSSNQNRSDIFDPGLRNKADVITEQIYSLDPFIEVFEYPEGITPENSDSFFGVTNGIEPKLDIIFEEVDDPRVKVSIRQKAREYRIPVIMVSDLGSSVQIDIRRFDLDENESLIYGTTDEFLLSKLDDFYDNPGSRSAFFEFVDVLIGDHYRTDELKGIIDGTREAPTSTIIPQLGSTVLTGSGIGAEIAARILLGHTFPDRMTFNKKTFESETFR